MNPKFKQRIKAQNGFVSIIAIGVFALMMIFAITLQMTTMDTLQSIKNNDNYLNSRLVADSTVEYLQWKMKNYAPGWNAGAKCVFSNGVLTAGGDNSLCTDNSSGSKLLDIMGSKNVTVEIKVKGRAEDAEKIKTAKCGAANNNCYVVPSPGTGDAGDETYCEMYKPAFTNANNPNATVPANLANGSNQLDQLNYSCNWNKLTFGSGLTDRVAVPLYYDSAAVGGASTIVNPFHKDTAPAIKAGNILVRLRTPCVPCGKTMANGQPRVCNDLVKDETVCNNGERYVLNVDNNPKTEDDDIVVQWLINGECDGDGKTETCGVIPIGDKTKLFSAFYESKINDVVNEQNNYNYIIIDKSTQAYDTNDYPDVVALLSSELYPIKLPLMFKPVLTLFLSKPLLTSEKWGNIPYLEYQILTDKPVSSNESILEVNVVVDGNGFTKTLAKEVPKQLIDFAIQN